MPASPQTAPSQYDPTIIAIEVIQSLQNNQAAQETAATQVPQSPEAGNISQDGGQTQITPPVQSSSPAMPETTPAQTAAPASQENVAQPVTQTAQSSTQETVIQDVETTVEAVNQIGPFGWVGVGLIICLVFACVLNIYLQRQRKEMDTPATKEDLEEIAPGAMQEN